jgi:hypothetical protein
MPIVYGFPGGDLLRRAELGQIVLGGCTILGPPFPPQPTRECPVCGLPFRGPGDRP